MKPSAGTASVLGMNRIKMDAPPTCAYIMLGNGCRNSCLFCAQGSREKEPECGKDRKFLSRVNWQNEKDEKVLNAISQKFETGDVRRVCYQVTDSPGIFDEVLSAVQRTKLLCDVPICVSITGISVKQIETLIEAGAEKIAFSFDAATPELYSRIKGRKWEDEWDLYETIIRMHPAVPVIHLIAGLGETENEMAASIALFYAMGSQVSLFAFTPLRGTPLADRKQPELKSYRKLQTVLYIIRKRKEFFDKQKDALLLNFAENPEIKNENGQKSMPFTGRTKIFENSDSFSLWNDVFNLKNENGENILLCDFLLNGLNESQINILTDNNFFRINSGENNVNTAVDGEFSRTGEIFPAAGFASAENHQSPGNFTSSGNNFDHNWLKHDIFNFEGENIFFNHDYAEFLEKSMPSEAYQTFGCADCNRPFYNEKPNQTPYNYPRELSGEELRDAVGMIFV